MDLSWFEIRPAERPEAGEMAALLRRSISELCTADHGNDALRLESWLRNKTEETVLHWIDGPGYILVARACKSPRRLLGVGMGMPTGEVVLNYVLPEARFCGVSKALMNAIETRFAEQGLAKARLRSTCTAERFYRSIGYVLIDRPRDPGDRASAVFEKDLAP